MQPEECKTIEELEACGQVPAYRLALANVFRITAREKRELKAFAARWLKRQEELTQGNQG